MKSILFNGGTKYSNRVQGKFFYESKFTDSSHKGGSSNIDSYRFPFSSASTIPDKGKSNDWSNKKQLWAYTIKCEQ